MSWWTMLPQLPRLRRRTLSLAERGERAAERYLKRQGMIIVARRDRTLNHEVDLVAVDRRTVVFVEVKTRSDAASGHPAEAVDAEKQRRVSRAAMAFIRRNDLVDFPVRFDVVAVIWGPEARRPQIQHFRHAFDYTGDQP